MKKWLLVLPLMALVPLRATADDSLVRFDGGIGVDPISGIVSNAPALNVVRGVPPRGFPWVIKRLRADVQSDGRITSMGAASSSQAEMRSARTAARGFSPCCSAELRALAEVWETPRPTARILR